MRLQFLDSLATDLVLVVFVIVCSETKLLELSTFLLLFSKCVHNISFISKRCAFLGCLSGTNRQFQIVQYERQPEQSQFHGDIHQS